ncbi:MAG: BtpA/SgcQ family protein [Phycisphaerales bacterium JB063]
MTTEPRPCPPLCPAWAGVRCPVIGMVHLRALPGAPGFGGSIGDVMDIALRDAALLERGGVDGLMIENFGDVPFFQGRVPAETVAAVTRVAGAVRDAVSLPIGINVLRNDALSALAVAAAVDASFVRVNVLSGTAVTDQGVIEGAAADVMRYRASLGASGTRVLADVRVKHAAPLVERPLQDEVEELLHRAGADAVIVSGSGTGKPTDLGLLAEVAQYAEGRPVFVGSGVTCDTVPAMMQHAGGLIVGTGVKVDGDVAKPVDPERVRTLMQAVRETENAAL